MSRLMESVRWVEECIVVDMDSHDRTCEIARQYGATVLQTPIVQRIDGIRNDFLERGRHEWVLVLDADEYLAADAESLIRDLLAQHGNDRDAFCIPRYNMIAGQIMRGSNWYPDQQIRLFRKGCVRWSDTTHKLPEVLTGQERLHTLEPPGCLHIHHENYNSVEQFIERQIQYALKDNYPANGFSFEGCVAKAYENGIGVVEDLSEAYTWYALACQTGFADASEAQKAEENRDRVKQRLISAYPHPTEEELDDQVLAQKAKIAQYQAEIKKVR